MISQLLSHAHSAYLQSVQQLSHNCTFDLHTAVLNLDCDNDRSSSNKILGLFRSSDTKSIALVSSELASEMIAECSARRSTKLILTSDNLRVRKDRLEDMGRRMPLRRQRRVWLFARISSFNAERIGSCKRSEYQSGSERLQSSKIH